MSAAKKIATVDVESDDLHPSLRNIIEQETLNWIFVGGKGDVVFKNISDDDIYVRFTSLCNKAVLERQLLLVVYQFNWLRLVKF